ncbi:MAG: chemotaxis protein CheW [Chromatiales bacterium]|nr:chemotaxis protein CheW [Chromatiales bacterium]
MVSEDQLQEIAVRCFVLELAGTRLLLPNTLIAEVTECVDVKGAGNSPGWLNGIISWRGRNVPLIVFEEILGGESPGRHDQTRMVVMNTLNNNPRIPFIAMEIQALPRLILLKHEMLEYDENNKIDAPVVYATLHLDGESMIVPNVDKIENMLESLGITA